MISIELLTLADVFKIVKSQKDLPIFMNPSVLNFLFPEVDWWLGRKGLEPLVLWPIPLSKEKQPASSGFLYYVGPHWCAQPRQSAQMMTYLDLYGKFHDIFVKRYSRFSFSISEADLDVRFFSWHAEYTADSCYVIKPRYSAVIRDLNVKSIGDIRGDYRQTRRNIIAKYQRSGHQMFELVAPPEVEEILALYVGRVGAQGGTTERSELTILAKLYELAVNGVGSITCVGNIESRRMELFCLSLRSSTTWNLTAIASTDLARRVGAQTFYIDQEILKAQSQGCSIFDFNGANSPLRGDDKHSFGAIPKLYFDITWS